MVYIHSFANIDIKYKSMSQRNCVILAHRMDHYNTFIKDERELQRRKANLCDMTSSRIKSAKAWGAKQEENKKRVHKRRTTARCIQAEKRRADKRALTSVCLWAAL